MKIGIIGTGNVGSILTRDLTRLGHDVFIANDDGPASLKKLAKDTGAKAVTLHEAASAKDIVIISVPQKAVPTLPIEIISKSSAIIIDTCNYFPFRDGIISEIENGLCDSEWVSKILGRPVVKAFNHMMAINLGKKGMTSGAYKRLALAISGDETLSKQVTVGLINRMGYDVVDAGKLSESWRQQPGTPIFCRDLTATALRAALERADQALISRYRKEANEEALNSIKKLG